MPKHKNPIKDLDTPSFAQRWLRAWTDRLNRLGVIGDLLIMSAILLTCWVIIMAALCLWKG